MTGKASAWSFASRFKLYTFVHFSSAVLSTSYGGLTFMKTFSGEQVCLRSMVQLGSYKLFDDIAIIVECLA